MDMTYQTRIVGKKATVWGGPALKEAGVFRDYH